MDTFIGVLSREYSFVMDFIVYVNFAHINFVIG